MQRTRSPANLPAAVGLLLVGLAAVGCGPTSPAGERGTAGVASSVGTEPVPGACVAGPVERRPLVLPGGLHAYVEPENLMRVGDELVVAGSPTYTWAVGDGAARIASTDAHIAAYVDAARPRLVRSPVDAPIGMVRTVALGEQRWGALFVEGEPADDGTAEPLTLVRMYYSEYDGDVWSAPERVPLPDGGALFPESSSPLVLAGERLHWVVVRRSGGEALHYERHAGTWTIETVEAGGAEAAGLAVGPSGLWVALSGFGPDAAGSRKSVRLLRHEGAGWRVVSRDPTAEPYTEIVGPSVLAGPGGVSVTWTEARGAGLVRARVGVRPDDSGGLVTIDPSAPAVRTFSSSTGEPRWALWHTGPGSASDQLRIARVRGGVVETEQAMPYPYTGYFAVVAAGPDEVVVSGSEFSPDSTRPTVRSLTFRLNPSCE